MWINENLIKFLESSCTISKINFYISDLKKIRVSVVPSKRAEMPNQLISREILESLLVIGTGVEQDKYIMINSKNDIIPMFEENSDDATNYTSQIILPIWADNELKGSLILVSENRKFDDYDLELARSVQIFIEESIINTINEEYLKKTEKKKVKSVLKKYDPSTETTIIKTETTTDENDM